jgi:hypothetical protein
MNLGAKELVGELCAMWSLQSGRMQCKYHVWKACTFRTCTSGHSFVRAEVPALRIIGLPSRTVMFVPLALDKLQVSAVEVVSRFFSVSINFESATGVLDNQTMLYLHNAKWRAG